MKLSKPSFSQAFCNFSRDCCSCEIILLIISQESVRNPRSLRYEKACGILETRISQALSSFSPVWLDFGRRLAPLQLNHKMHKAQDFPPVVRLINQAAAAVGLGAGVKGILVTFGMVLVNNLNPKMLGQGEGLGQITA